jgi:hypothetical protein
MPCHHIRAQNDNLKKTAQVGILSVLVILGLLEVRGGEQNQDFKFGN